MPLQPAKTLIVTAGRTGIKNLTKKESGKNFWAFHHLEFLSRVSVILLDGEPYPELMYLEITDDGDQTEAGTRDPLWTYHVEQTESATKENDNDKIFEVPLETAAVVHLQFRKDAPYPDGTVFVPTGKINILVLGYSTAVSIQDAT
jgi:hypothetical protein